MSRPAAIPFCGVLEVAALIHVSLLTPRFRRVHHVLPGDTASNRHEHVLQSGVVQPPVQYKLERVHIDLSTKLACKTPCSQHTLPSCPPCSANFVGSGTCLPPNQRDPCPAGRKQATTHSPRLILRLQNVLTHPHRKPINILGASSVTRSFTSSRCSISTFKDTL